MTTVVIVGRPNVGKSTLFNRLVGRRKALVHNEPGVTRDLNYARAEYLGKTFELVDTGGIYGATADPLHDIVQDQAGIAIEGGDIILLLVDGKDGVLPIDKELAKKLRGSGKKVILVVNKVDEESHLLRGVDFYSLGISPLIPVSAEHGARIDDLLDEITANILPEETEEQKENVVRVAIVGKPNVGKSSMLNRILGQKRSLVSDMPGTTRDPVDSVVAVGERKFAIVDTAGIRKKSKTERGAELLSVILAKKALLNCDVALLVVDASKAPSHQDAYIAGLIGDSQKGSLVLLNKWDLINGEKEAREIELLFSEKFAFAPYLLYFRVSALTGRGMKGLFSKVEKVYDNFEREFPTSGINRVLGVITREVAPPSVKGKEFKIRYGTQVGKAPPRFALFTNSASPPPDSYARYLKNRLMESFDIQGTPFILHFRKG